MASNFFSVVVQLQSIFSQAEFTLFQVSPKTALSSLSKSQHLKFKFGTIKININAT